MKHYVDDVAVILQNAGGPNKARVIDEFDFSEVVGTDDRERTCNISVPPGSELSLNISFGGCFSLGESHGVRATIIVGYDDQDPKSMHNFQAYWLPGCTDDRELGKRRSEKVNCGGTMRMPTAPIWGMDRFTIWDSDGQLGGKRALTAPDPDVDSDDTVNPTNRRNAKKASITVYIERCKLDQWQADQGGKREATEPPARSSMNPNEQQVIYGPWCSTPPGSQPYVFTFCNQRMDMDPRASGAIRDGSLADFFLAVPAATQDIGMAVGRAMSSKKKGMLGGPGKRGKGPVHRRRQMSKTLSPAVSPKPTRAKFARKSSFRGRYHDGYTAPLPGQSGRWEYHSYNGEGSTEQLANLNHNQTLGPDPTAEQIANYRETTGGIGGITSQIDLVWVLDREPSDGLGTYARQASVELGDDGICEGPIDPYAAERRKLDRRQAQRAATLEQAQAQDEQAIDIDKLRTIKRESDTHVPAPSGMMSTLRRFSAGSSTYASSRQTTYAGRGMSIVDQRMTQLEIELAQAEGQKAEADGRAQEAKMKVLRLKMKLAESQADE